MRRILVNPHRRSSEKRKYDQNKESEIEYTVDWSLVVANRTGVTAVSSVAWSSEGSQSLSVSDEDLTSNVASCLVTSSNSGFGLLKCVATFNDGKTESQYIEVNIHDPERR